MTSLTENASILQREIRRLSPLERKGLRNYLVVIIYLFKVEMLPFFRTSSRFAFDSLLKQEHCHASGLRFAGSPILY